MSAPGECPAPLIPQLSDRCKAFGFDPGVPVFGYIRVRFSPMDIGRAMFESTYRSRKRLIFPGTDVDAVGPVEADLEMDVELAQRFFEPRYPDGPGYYDYADWYLRGKALFTGSDDRVRCAPAHAYLVVVSRDVIETAYVQVVHKATGADPNTPLVYGSRLPD